MLNPRYQRYAVRLSQLIKESNLLLLKISANKLSSSNIQSFETKAINIVSLVFGKNSIQFGLIKEIGKNIRIPKRRLLRFQGILIACLDDLKNGFLSGQEFIVASEVFDSVLEEAKYLNSRGHKDAAAVLCRVVLEDALKRIAREEGISDNQKASKINEDLWKANRFTKIQWRLQQSWLDTGNDAAHGKFNQYNEQQVNDFANGLTNFLATEFR